jgi:hypothetical protein
MHALVKLAQTGSRNVSHSMMRRSFVQKLGPRSQPVAWELILLCTAAIPPGEYEGKNVCKGNAISSPYTQTCLTDCLRAGCRCKRRCFTHKRRLRLNRHTCSCRYDGLGVITCKRGRAKHSVKDDHAFLWKHAIFSHLPS